MMHLLLFSQETDSLSSGNEVISTENIDTVKTFSEPVDTPDEESESTSESAPENVESKPENPFLAEPVTLEEAEETIKSDSRLLDIIMDLSIGVNYTNLIKVTPEHYSLGGRYNFQFGFGIMVPFFNVFFAKVAVNYFHASYTTSYTTPDAIDMYTKVKSIEELHFLSAPVDLGMSFDLGRIIPFIYYQCMPALLTSAGRDTQIRIHTPFSDTATLIGTTNETKDITMDRERHQIFMGAGAGLEFFYGYGTIYIAGGFQVPILDPGNSNSSPGRTESSFVNIPIMLGIRFYL